MMHSAGRKKGKEVEGLLTKALFAWLSERKCKRIISRV